MNVCQPGEYLKYLNSFNIDLDLPNDKPTSSNDLQSTYQYEKFRKSRSRSTKKYLCHDEDCCHRQIMQGRLAEHVKRYHKAVVKFGTNEVASFILNIKKYSNECLHHTE